MEKTSTSTLSGNYRHLSCIINWFILFDYFLKSKNYLEIKQSLFLKKKHSHKLRIIRYQFNKS